MVEFCKTRYLKGQSHEHSKTGQVEALAGGVGGIGVHVRTALSRPAASVL